MKRKGWTDRLRLAYALAVLASAGCGGGGGGSTSGSVDLGGITPVGTPSGSSSGNAGDGGAGAGTVPGNGSTGSTSSGTGGDTPGAGTGTGSGNTPSLGVLRPNAIYFGHWGDATRITSVLPDGTGRRDATGTAGQVVCAVPDVLTSGGVVYALSDGLHCGVYRGVGFDPATAQLLAAPVYDYVSALQQAQDGSVILVAAEEGVSSVYLLANGTATRLDAADAATISRDGTKIAYTKLVNGQEILRLWTRSGGTRDLTTAGDSMYPSFNADGDSILFSSNANGSGDTPFDLYAVPAMGGSPTRLTNTPAISELGASYGPDGTGFAYVAFTTDGSAQGVYVRKAGGAPLRLAADDDVRFATYWTDYNGRSSEGIGGARYQRLREPGR